MSRKRLVSAMLGALAATAFIAPAAQAQPVPDDTFGAAACLVTAVGNAAVDSVEKDLALSGGGGGPNDGGASLWLLDVDSGNFSLAGTAICGKVDVGSRTPYTAAGGWAVAAGTAYIFTAGGTYNSLFCGTMTLNGTANLNGPANLLAMGNVGDGRTDIDFGFGITFAAFHGPGSFVVEPGADGSGGNRVGNNVVTGGNGAGAFVFIPTTGSCVQGEGVTGFTLTGAFATSFSGDGGFGG